MIKTVEDFFLREQTQLIMRNKMIGTMSLFLNVEASDDIETFGTDGRTLFINPNAINVTGELGGFGNGEVVFHTLLHIIKKHLFATEVDTDVLHDEILDVCDSLSSIERGFGFNKEKLKQMKDDHSLWKNTTPNLIEFWDEKIRFAYSVWGRTTPNANNGVYSLDKYEQERISKFVEKLLTGYDVKVDDSLETSLFNKLSIGVVLPTIEDIIGGKVSSPNFDEADSVAVMFSMLKQVQPLQFEELTKEQIQNLFIYVKGLPRLATIVFMKDTLKKSLEEIEKRVAVAKENGTLDENTNNRKYLSTILAMKDWIEWSKKYKNFIM